MIKIVAVAIVICALRMVQPLACQAARGPLEIADGVRKLNATSKLVSTCVTTFVFSPSGHIALANTDGLTAVFKLPDCSEVAKFSTKGTLIEDLKFVPNSTVLLVATSCGDLIRFDYSSQQMTPLVDVTKGSTSKFGDPKQFHPYGPRIIVDDSGKIGYVHGLEYAILNSHAISTEINVIQIGKTCSFAVPNSVVGNARIGAGGDILIIKNMSPVKDVFSSERPSYYVCGDVDSRTGTLVCGTIKGAIKVWDTRSNRQRNTYEMFNEEAKRVCCHPKRTLVYGASREKLAICETVQNKSKKIDVAIRRLYGIALDPSGEVLVGYGIGGLQCWLTERLPNVE